MESPSEDDPAGARRKLYWPRTVDLSRRTVLLTAIASPGLVCSRRAAPPAATTTAVPPDPWGGLSVAILGGDGLRGEPRGGTAVVLLHGWGAPGDDLVGLAQMMAPAHPRARFFVPAAPLPEVGGGRAWWHLDPHNPPEHARDDQAPARAPHPDLKAARVAVQSVLRTVRQRYAPERLCLAGFSQGAMLSLDVALDAAPPVDRVAALSGLLLVDSLPGLRAAHTTRPTVFMSHGRGDPRLPFSSGARARELLERHGYQVAFHPFDGGHEIPPEVVGALAEFLFG
jgi:phospholipase/carboxylesterase